MQEFEPYRELIEQLKSSVERPDFNQSLSTLGAHISHEKRLLVKMELQRLARPCHKLIDLRGIVDGRCRLYQHGGLSHYLDDVAIDVFERQLRSFGRYTQGVYEAVIDPDTPQRVASHEDAGALTEQTQLKLSLRPTPLGDDLQRSEERMNFKANVEIFDADGHKFKGVTQDISVQGLRIRETDGRGFKKGQRLLIKFIHLSGDYHFDFREAIPYQVVSKEGKPGEQRLALKRTYIRDTPSFDHFLQRFIHGNKRKYKINVDNTVQAIVSKGLEQYIIATSHSLPVFLQNRQEQLVPAWVLQNENNAEVLQYWIDDNRQLQLSHLLSHNRLRHLQQTPDNTTYVYCCYMHTGNQRQLYSASWEELATRPKFANAFRAKAARCASYRVFKLQLHNLHQQHNQVPLSMPESEVSSSVASPFDISTKVKNLDHLVAITDITAHWNKHPYLRFNVSAVNVSAFRHLAHPKEPKHHIPVLRYRYGETRPFESFHIRTTVSVETHHQKLQGYTDKVSISGIELELNSQYQGQLHDDVAVSFSPTSVDAAKTTLPTLHYEVIAISADRQTLRLSLTSPLGADRALKFLNQVVEDYRPSLQSFQASHETLGLGEVLRNQLAANITGIPVFFANTQRRFMPQYVMKVAPSHPLFPLLEYGQEHGEYNLRFLLDDNQGEALNQALNHLKANARPKKLEFFIQFNRHAEDSESAFIVRLVDGFQTDKARREFIQQAKRQSEFFAVAVYIFRTGKPDVDMLKEELRYVGIYEQEKVRQLEDKLWSITAFAQLHDVTGECCARYGLAEQSATQQQLS